MEAFTVMLSQTRPGLLVTETQMFCVFFRSTSTPIFSD